MLSTLICWWTMVPALVSWSDKYPLRILSWRPLLPFPGMPFTLKIISVQISHLGRTNGQINALVEPENNHHRGEYHCMADPLFNWFGFDQTSKAVSISTYAKQLNPNKINKRSAIQWYLGWSYCSLLELIHKHSISSQSLCLCGSDRHIAKA